MKHYARWNPWKNHMQCVYIYIHTCVWVCIQYGQYVSISISSSDLVIFYQPYPCPWKRTNFPWKLMVGRCLISHKKWSKYQVTTLHLMAVPRLWSRGQCQVSGKDCRKKVDRSTKGGGKNGQKLPEREKILANKLFFVADSNSLDGNVATHPDIFGCAVFFKMKNIVSSI